MAGDIHQHGQIAVCALDLAHSQLLDGRPQAARETLVAQLGALAESPQLSRILRQAADTQSPTAFELQRVECEQHLAPVGYAKFAPLSGFIDLTPTPRDHP